MHARGHLEEKAILFSTAIGGGDLVIGRPGPAGLIS
jgi:hypothetical protein